MLGMGVMINMLGGNEESNRALERAIGKEITDIRIDPSYEDGRLVLVFKDGDALTIRDDGRSCCESRYMHTDDKLSDFADSTLVKVEIKDGPTTNDAWGEPHEMQFLIVTTSRGAFTIETHNEHNGYYGGFWIVCAYFEKADKPKFPA